MKKIFLLWLFLVCGFLSFSQKITVIDVETNEPIRDVLLTSQTLDVKAITDANGQVDINIFKNSGDVLVSATGYKSLIISYKDVELTNFVLYLTLTGFPLDELVVSANRNRERKADVSQKVQVIRQSDLQNMNQTSMADVVANSGNIMVQKSQLGGGSPVIRGFEANKVLIVVDGVRMNNAIYRGGHLQNIVTLDNAAMERVEVLFGPGSVMYGSDALGGVMHFYTKNPTLSNTDSILMKANAFTRYFSAANGYSAHADVSLANRRFGALSSITLSSFGDLKQGSVRNPFYESFGSRPWSVQRIDNKDSIVPNTNTNVQVGSGYKQYDLMQKFMFQQSEKVTHLLNVQFSNSSDVPRYDRLTQKSKDLPKYAEWYYGPQKRFFTSYNLILKNKNKFYDESRLIFGYQNIEESRNSRRYQSNFLTSQVEKLNVFTFNEDLVKSVQNHTIRYGIEAFYNQVGSTAKTKNIVADTTSSAVTRYPSGGSTMTSVAAYGSHTFKINSKLILNDGIRISQVNLHSKFTDKTFFPFPYDEVNQSNMAVTGNLGLVATPTKGYRITINFSTGFRVPNVDDMSKVFESVAGSIIVPNPNLKPEYTYNGELGITRTFDQKVRISVLGYYTLFRNVLNVQPADYQGEDSIMCNGGYSRVTTTTNSSSAYIYGFETMLTGNISEHFSLYGTFNYTYGRIQTDSTDIPLDHVAPIFGKFGMDVHENNWRIEMFTNFSGWKRLDDYNSSGEDNLSYATSYGMPAWFTLNSRFSYNLQENLSLQLACENILNQNYRVFASNISAPGRNFNVTLRYKL